MATEKSPPAKTVGEDSLLRNAGVVVSLEEVVNTAGTTSTPEDVDNMCLGSSSSNDNLVLGCVERLDWVLLCFQNANRAISRAPTAFIGPSDVSSETDWPRLAVLHPLASKQF